MVNAESRIRRVTLLCQPCRKLVKALLVSIVALIATHGTSFADGNDSHHPNVLFIVVDDLRPALGCYEDVVAITPSIDRLARRGLVFNRAYCQLAVCSPSRLSTLTGRRPDTIRVWDLNTHFRKAIPDVVTLPQYFKKHGYHTQSIGKVLHGSGKPSKDPPSWSVDPKFDFVRDPAVRYALEKNLAGKGLKRASSEAANVADNVYIDGIVCEAAMSALSELKGKHDRDSSLAVDDNSQFQSNTDSKQPFFLAVGFRKPHLPFCAPAKYWSLYERGMMPLPATNKYPVGAPELATRSWKELEGYSDISNDGSIPVEQVRKLRHGYYACVSYVDGLVGRLLQKLEELELADETVVVLWGDHGFHLGEQGLWTKANNYELSTRVPLIISVPGQKNQGSKTNALVELVDIYPTLAEICGLEKPKSVEGTSLRPLMGQPDLPWKRAVFSQYPRDRTGNRHRGHGDIMGYAMKTDRFRYVEWREWKTQKIVSRELYDHQTDPDEMQNVVERIDPDIVHDLNLMMKRGWMHALPK